MLSIVDPGTDLKLRNLNYQPQIYTKHFYQLTSVTRDVIVSIITYVGHQKKLWQQKTGNAMIRLNTYRFRPKIIILLCFPSSAVCHSFIHTVATSRVVMLQSYGVRSTLGIVDWPWDRLGDAPFIPDILGVWKPPEMYHQFITSSQVHWVLQQTMASLIMNINITQLQHLSKMTQVT